MNQKTMASSVAADGVDESAEGVLRGPGRELPLAQADEDGHVAADDARQRVAVEPHDPPVAPAAGALCRDSSEQAPQAKHAAVSQTWSSKPNNQVEQQQFATMTARFRKDTSGKMYQDILFTKA